ncbi:NADH-quinone oxidoreductase subunit H, partial [Stenotrophomonas sp. 3diitr2024]|uniref:NADH-quinone oxidoreductase subunit H n=1 Tax=Stenotrophomonas sp. 3diitr2024 TaxID=3345115 RepID=UPI0035CA1100
ASAQMISYEIAMGFALVGVMIASGSLNLSNIVAAQAGSSGFFDWFLREEFEQLFPASVVQWLVTQAGPPLEVEGRRYYHLPQGPKLPVL